MKKKFNQANMDGIKPEDLQRRSLSIELYQQQKNFLISQGKKTLQSGHALPQLQQLYWDFYGEL